MAQSNDTTRFQVTVSRMNGGNRSGITDVNYKTALNYYAQKCDENNIEDGAREWPAVGNGEPVEVSLTAGGRGYDVRIELTEYTEEN